MSFATNHSQQISLFDATANLTDREKRLLEKSWAKYFAENIFTEIDEKPFSVLYSDRPSRHNTPVNVIIGALILKEIFGLTDEEIVETLPFDIRYQYALHTTSFEEQPLNDRTLGRFRAISEQTKSDDDGNLTLKGAHDDMDSNIMQNPADPDATYRKKAGTEYRGYIANVVEVADNDHNSITVDYQYGKNTYSDSQFLKDYMEQQPDDGSHAILTTDGGYCGMENSLLAEEKNITLVTTRIQTRCHH